MISSMISRFTGLSSTANTRRSLRSMVRLLYANSGNPLELFDERVIDVQFYDFIKCCEQRVHNYRIKLQSPRSRDFIPDFVGIVELVVRVASPLRVKRVCDAYDSRGKWYTLPAKAVWISAAIKGFMVPPRDRSGHL